MKIKSIWTSVLVVMLLFGAGSSFASDRMFTYTYEPETMAEGTLEFENFVTWRTVRNDAVGKNHYTRWDLKQELEYGVTDNYMIALGMKEKSEYFRNPSTNAKTSESEFEGVLFENRWMILDPAKNPVGLTIYVEPSIGNGEFELEEKIILGQRFGEEQRWKWAFNISHATEWKDAEDPGEEDETEGELEFDLGITREMSKNWNLGIEFRNINKFPEYDDIQHSAFFVGPAVNYRQENWFATLTFLTQAYGDNNKAVDPDGESSADLEEYERFNTRLIIGIDF